MNKSEIRPRILDILKRLEIENLMEKRPIYCQEENLKSGSGQALVFNPELLLLDEPTSNIDPEAIEILEREILRFNQETGGTVIIVTHNLEQSRRLGHRIIEM